MNHADGDLESRARRHMAEADRRMADAEALLDIASAQLSVAARNIASANAAEREYRRAVWHYTQLMKHRISNPLQTIIGMADTLLDMPELERSRRQAMVEAIGQQARVLREVTLEPRVVAEHERVLQPLPLEGAVRMHHRRADPPPHPDGQGEPSAHDRDEDTAESPRRSPFSRFRKERRDDTDTGTDEG